ncbi:unnamed protein product [Urochloa humidicola]
MAALLHRLLRSRRNAAATIASAAFLSLLLILSVLLATTKPDAAAFPVSFLAGAAYPENAAAAAAAAAPSSSPAPSCEAALRTLPDAASRCRYLSSPGHPPCAPSGYADYLQLFYCFLTGRRPPWVLAGGAAMALWLLVLFYLLGDTASSYFCASLEGLSAALRLPPAIAGVTLLSLGNGAPDVLSSVVAFAAGGEGEGGDAGDVGLSGVLGGALFVSTVVAGVVALVASRRRREGEEVVVIIERRGFVRDVCFLLVALCYLLGVLLTGVVTVWAAAAFLSLYAAYVLLVSLSHCCPAADAGEEAEDAEDDLLLLPEYDSKNKKAAAADDGNNNNYDDLAAPLLDDAPSPPLQLPVVSYCKPTTPPEKSFSRRAMDVLQWPLYLPRRLTIPDIAGDSWSKPYAVSSAFLSPLLLAFIASPTNPIFLLSGAALGTLLAAIAFHTTTSTSPPATRYGRLPWLAGGFLMSVLWSYLIARELVALLVSIGLVAGVKASVLGATVLAWGNSLGDLVADVAMAAHGGAPGAQTAVAGCYAGPAFNMVVGLGLSLVMAAAARYPRPYVIPADASSAYQAAGFLVGALVWALVVMNARGMRLDRVLGVGLLVVYLGFLAVRLGSLGAFGS